jgi:hypothetical protein
MLKGLYKVEMHTVHGSRRGVIYAYDGKMMGGNSALAFIGTYREHAGGEVSADISTLRHRDDVDCPPLFKTDQMTLTLKGRQRGERYHFEGRAAQLPGIAFNSVMTPLSEEAAPAIPRGEPGGIGNGLYSIDIRMLDGLGGGNTGVMVLHDGRIRGGDACSIMWAVIAAQMANGRAKSSIMSTRRAMAGGRCSAATRSASVFPAPTPIRARSRKPPRSPASAAFASARC